MLVTVSFKFHSDFTGMPLAVLRYRCHGVTVPTVTVTVTEIQPTKAETV